MTTLNQTLEQIAAQLHAPAQELIEYANQDALGGFHIVPELRKFPMGSAWEVELKTLYALVRHLKPETIVEIGGLSGASATHIAAAIKANGKGHLYSIDNGVLGAIHGELIPSDLRQYVTLVEANGEDWLVTQDDNSIGLIFEDAAHGMELVRLLSAISLEKLVAGGVLVNHDAGHDQFYDGNSFTNGVFNGQQGASDVGRNVRDGLAQANAYFRVYRADPSDCGLAITVKPGAKKGGIVETLNTIVMGDSHPELMEQFGGMNSAKGQGVISEVPQQLGNANIESVSEPPPVIEKKRRTRKPKA